jgi:hypothetical protein
MARNGVYDATNNPAFMMMQQQHNANAHSLHSQLLAQMHMGMPHATSVAGPAPAPHPKPKPQPKAHSAPLSQKDVEVMNYMLPVAGALALSLLIVAANRH